MPRFTYPKLVLPRWRWLVEVVDFSSFLQRYFRTRAYRWFSLFENIKDVLVDLLYQKRGKYSRPFLHFGTIGLIFFVIIVGPVVLQEAEKDEEGQNATPSILAAFSTYGQSFITSQATEVSQYRGGEIITHSVQDGETLSSIASRYGLQVSTLAWENSISDKAKLKPGQELRILPVDGIRHKVQRGETIYSIGKKYSLDESQVQSIVDYPFNEFLNDETFELATGQYIIVPDGVRQDTAVAQPVGRFGVQVTPDAGSVTARGTFVWPTAGRITQKYAFYHKGVDIANLSGGPIVAADSGTVIVAGWPDNSGYGNRVLIDHGNGFVTLYAHMSLIQVRQGQRVNRGDLLGQMGSTGRSTGVHLHFEIRQGGTYQNPLSFLQ